jgi:hypothetical protein
MKILHTITCTKYCPAYQVRREFTRHLIRSRRLSEKGIQRMFGRGCAEYDADPYVCVTRIETAVDYR